MHDLTGPTKRCTSGRAAGEKPCGQPLQARMIQSAVVEAADLQSVVFSKTLPVLLCPRCDTAPQRKRDTVHPPE